LQPFPLVARPYTPLLPANRQRTIDAMGKTTKTAVGLAATIVLAAGALELWTRRPVPPPDIALDIPAGTTTLVLVTHGSADAGDPLLIRIVAELQARYRDVPGAAVRFLRWAPQSDERLRAAATAQAAGRRLGEKLAEIPGLRELQIIAHSSGAFMPDAICRAYRAAVPFPARVSMVLLDPFLIQGFIDWSWGARHHGECADFALAVINTDDPAPATNRPLANAYNVDVTGAPGSASFQPNGHYWPLEYYRAVLLPVQAELARRSFADYPRGAVHTVR
jgi:hypothetical protein